MLKKFFNHFEEYACIVFMLLMSVSISLGIITRVVGSPLAWTAEVARYSFIWGVFMGAVVATKNKGHIVIDVFTNLFPEKTRKVLIAAGTIVSLVMLSMMVYYGFILTYEFWNTQMALLPYTIGIVYASFPTCAALMVLRILQGAYRDFSSGREAETA